MTNIANSYSQRRSDTYERPNINLGATLSQFLVSRNRRFAVWYIILFDNIAVIVLFIFRIRFACVPVYQAAVRDKP